MFVIIPDVDVKLNCAAAAESLCVRAKGTIPSMPERKAILQLLKDHPATVRDEDLPNEEQVLLLLKEHFPFGGENETTPDVEKLKPAEDPLEEHPVTTS